jgi:predicted XRE-type DNA-binding protein
MKLRSALLTALKDHITRAGMSQAQAARLLGVTQPRVSDLMRGKISLFGLDALVNMAAAAGLHIEMRPSGRPAWLVATSSHRGRTENNRANPCCVDGFSA